MESDSQFWLCNQDEWQRLRQGTYVAPSVNELPWYEGALEYGSINRQMWQLADNRPNKNSFKQKFTEVNCRSKLIKLLLEVL